MSKHKKRIEILTTNTFFVFGFGWDNQFINRTQERYLDIIIGCIVIKISINN